MTCTLRVSPGFMSDNLLAELRQKIFRRQMQPEFLPAVQFLLASGTISLIGIAVDRSLKSITAKSPIASSRSGTSTKSAD